MGKEMFRAAPVLELYEVVSKHLTSPCSLSRLNKTEVEASGLESVLLFVRLRYENKDCNQMRLALLVNVHPLLNKLCWDVMRG
jgi:hypothetical protein